MQTTFENATLVDGAEQPNEEGLTQKISQPQIVKKHKRQGRNSRRQENGRSRRRVGRGRSRS